MTIDDNRTRILRLIGYISGLFTLFVAVIMILGFIQLQLIKPLENPSLEALKTQYDSDPNNENLKEQVRALDLMSRRAFFATRWQIETGTYLLIISAAIFILSQRMLIAERKRRLDKPEDIHNLLERSRTSRIYLTISTISVIGFAFIISFILRKNLPDPLPVVTEVVAEGVSHVVQAPVSRPVTANIETPDSGSDIVNDEVTEPVESSSPESVEEKVSPTPKVSTSNSLSYPFFRGEGGRGIAPKGSYPTNWDGKVGTNIKWKVEVPKAGFSSPVIWEDKIFLTGAEGASTEVMCFNRTNGELLWTAAATGIEGEPATPPKTSEDTGIAAPTAAVNGEVVCAIFGTGNVICLDHNGNRIWAKNIGVPDNHYGHSSSLIIHENILIIQYDHFKKKSVIGLDIKSGNQLWETIRSVAISWASPVLAKFNGATQVILTSEPAVISYNAKTGKELWSINCMSGEVGPSVAVNSKNVFAVNEFAKLVSIKPGSTPAIVWEDNEYTSEVSSPVANEEFVFILTTWGAVACYRADSGELAWSHDFDYGFYSSPILVGDNVYMLDQAGVMHIVKAKGEFELVSEPALGERANCTPAFIDGKIYIRSDDHLYCISD